jgi:hypothetical protein
MYLKFMSTDDKYLDASYLEEQTNEVFKACLA